MQAVRIIYCEPALTTHIIRQADVDLSSLREAESILCYSWTPSGSLLLGCSGGRVLAVHHAVPPAVPSDEWGSRESYLEAVEIFPNGNKQFAAHSSGGWGGSTGGGCGGAESAAGGGGGSGGWASECISSARYGMGVECSSVTLHEGSSGGGSMMTRSNVGGGSGRRGGMAAGGEEADGGEGESGYGGVVAIVPMPEHIVLLFSGGE